MQTNATKTTHNHDGSLVNGLTANGPKLLQANTHETPDTNVSAASLHHTLGGGATQAAAGNHLHAGTYVDLSTTQTITGKKIFPAGNPANSIDINDFTNSIHNHTSTPTGGYAAVRAMTNSGASLAAHPSSLAAGTTYNFWLTFGWILPANCSLVGTWYQKFILSASSVEKSGDYMNYLSFTAPSNGPIPYRASQNCIVGRGDHDRIITRTSNATDQYFSMATPIWVAPAAVDRQGAFGAQIVNRGALFGGYESSIVATYASVFQI